jgi:hypothetical protein
MLEWITIIRAELEQPTVKDDEATDVEIPGDDGCWAGVASAGEPI